MSTKTTFKRVALVAVASMGFGMLSVVSASAAAVLDANMAQTGTAGTNGSYVLASATGITAINTVTTDTALACGWTVTDPSGTASIIGTGVAAAAVGTAAIATSVCTLTFASTYLSATGKYTISNVSDTVAADLNTAAKITTAAATAASEETTSFFVYKTTPSFTGGLGRTVTSATNIAQDVNGTVTYYIVSDDTSATYAVTATGATILSVFGDNTGKVVAQIAATTGDTVTNNNGTSPAGGVTWTPNVVKKSYLQVKVTSAVAGTSTLTVQPLTASGVPGTAVTASATWGSTPAAGAQFSTVYLNAGTTQATTANDDTVAGVSCSKTIATQCANIAVAVFDTAGAALDGKALSVTITGPGTLGLDTDNSTAAALDYTTAATGRALSATALTASFAAVTVWPDGSTGAATITISSGTVVLATKTINFYGTVATLTATQNLKVARASAAGAELGTSSASATWLTTATTPAVYIVALDSTGVIVPGLTITALSSDAAVIISGAVTQDDATAGDGPGYYNASVTSAAGGVSGASGTVTFRTQLSTGAYVSTAAVTFTLGGSLATMTLTLDKAAYTPGESMIVTRTAKDSAGNPVYDGVASPAVIFSKAIGGTAPAAGEFASGASSSSTSRPTVFAPSLTGAFEARASYTNATTLATSQITASATVSDDSATAASNAATAASTAAADAAAEATDAANAATDAANAAAEAADAATAAAQDASDAVAALAAQVATLIAGLKAQLTALTNLIIKIQKKVKA